MRIWRDITTVMSALLLLIACGEKNDGRAPVAGTGTDSKVSAEQDTDSGSGDTESSASDTGDGTTDTGTDGGEPAKPKIQTVGFTCAKGEVKYQIDGGTVETFTAADFPTTDKDEKTNFGIYPYLVPGQTKSFAISYFSYLSEDYVPGDIFAGWIVWYRGDDKELNSCSDNAAENYFKYIAGNASAPFARHLEGVIFNLYSTPDCSGPVVFKKYSFCINSVNSR